MNWKAILCGLCVALSATGCGGGRGDSFVGIPSDDPTTAVLNGEREMNEDLVFENTGRVVGFYSNVYQDSKNRSKADIKTLAEQVFDKVDILRIDALDPTLDPDYKASGATDPLLTNPDGTLVNQRVFTYVAFRFRSTGVQHTIIIRGQYQWVNEKGAWRISNSDEGVLDRLQARINGENVSITPEDSIVR
jgi:hypothetical protein